MNLVQSREDISQLLKLDGEIDLVIPRGSNSLVKYIKSNTRIPVMGHSDGVCHIFVDSHADITKTLRIIIDSKTDYPSACNAVETVLLHSEFADSTACDELLKELRKSGIMLFGGVQAIARGLVDRPAESMSTEYGDLRMTIEVVDDVYAAIKHINRYGSGHTESIITENARTAEEFIRDVDSACVFHNASTRFADGYRYISFYSMQLLL